MQMFAYKISTYIAQWHCGGGAKKETMVLVKIEKTLPGSLFISGYNKKQTYEDRSDTYVSGTQLPQKSTCYHNRCHSIHE